MLIQYVFLCDLKNIQRRINRGTYVTEGAGGGTRSNQGGGSVAGRGFPPLRPAHSPPLPLWPRPVPGYSESPEPGAACAAGTLAPRARPHPGGSTRSGAGKARTPGTRSGSASDASRGPAYGSRGGVETEPRARGGAAGAGRVHLVGQGRAAARAGGRHAAGQRPGCGSVAGLAAPPLGRARPAPWEFGGSSPGRGGRVPVQPGPAARVWMPGAVPRAWHVTRACVRPVCSPRVPRRRCPSVSPLPRSRRPRADDLFPSPARPQSRSGALCSRRC